MTLLPDIRMDIADDGSASQIIPLIPHQSVQGPGSSTDNAIATWDGTSGDSIQESLATIDDAGNIETPGGMTLGDELNLNGAISLNCRVITAAGSVTALDSDTVIAINKVSSEITNVILQNSTTDGKLLIIKDKKGDASSYNIIITVSGGGLIDGLSGFILTQNYQSVTLLFCNSSWCII